MRRAPVLLVPLVLLGALLVGCGEGEGQEMVDTGGEVVATIDGPTGLGFELDENGDVLPADGSSPTSYYEQVPDPTHLVRTDFSDDAAWRRAVELVTAGVDFGDGYGPYEPYVETLGRSARRASEQLAVLNGAARSTALRRIAALIRQRQAALIESNAADVEAAFDKMSDGPQREIRYQLDSMREIVKTIR